MSPPSNKICKLCGVGFRGTATPEEVHCAKCFVKTCEVPEDTDEQFLKLVSEAHGPELSTISEKPHQTTKLMPMMKDILNHKARLAKLKGNVEQLNKSTKEKNRMKREIYRLREEQDEMDSIMEGIKAKMVHFVLMTSKGSPKSPGKSVTDSPPKTPKTPVFPKVPTNTPTTVTPFTPPPSKTSSPSKIPSVASGGSTPATSPTTPVSSVTAAIITPKSPPRSPGKEKPQKKQQQQPPPPSTPPAAPKSPNASPVKLTALKFEAAAKKVNSVVTFAITPTTKPKARDPEVNNNDTPVTASSSSEEECDENEDGFGEGQPSALTRSNSVRDRIKVTLLKKPI